MSFIFQFLEMDSMNFRPKIFCIASIIILVSFAFFAQAETIHPWEVLTLTFESSKEYSNPYREIPAGEGDDLLQVTFLGTSGKAEGQSITICGAWDGKNKWVVNFSAPASGTWAYISISPDRGLNKKKGKIIVEEWTEKELTENPARRGLVQVRKEGKQAGHFFKYADGTPFLWIADTWWNWTKRSIRMETFEELVDDRSAKGFAIGQLFVPGNGWGRESSLLDSSFSVLDVDHTRHVEEMIRYANSKGITVWIHGWWSRPDIDEHIGAEKIKRWWKYLIHRFGAYNVVWVLAGEYNMHNNGGFDIDFWNELGEMVKTEDPYDRIVSVHNTPPFWSGGADAPQWATGEVLHGEEWLDYNQSQVGHGKYANEMIPQIVEREYRRTPAKPIVVTEPWYEFIEGNPTGMDVRLAAWGSILSGAAGHTYGGGHVWLAHVPESQGGGGPWPLEEEFERTTYDYEGAASMKHLADLFSDIKWWEMAPHPELVTDYPQPFCLANPGEEYVLYLRYGGGLKLQVPPENDQYSFFWYNPATGKRYGNKNVSGAGVLDFNCPESYPAATDYKDWVLYVKKK